MDSVEYVLPGGQIKTTPATLTSGFSGLSSPDFQQRLFRGINPAQPSEMTDAADNAATGLTSTQDIPQAFAFVNEWAGLDMWWFSIALMFVCLIIMWLICCVKRKRARPRIYRPIIVLNPDDNGIHRLDGLKHMFFSLTV